jgi:hypothetical protein
MKEQKRALVRMTTWLMVQMDLWPMESVLYSVNDLGTTGSPLRNNFRTLAHTIDNNRF